MKPSAKTQAHGSPRDSAASRVAGRRAQAGLLWRLLGKPGRDRVARDLDPELIAAANKAFEKDYRSLPAKSRAAVDRQLHRALRTGHGSGPLVASVLLGLTALVLIVLHAIQIPHMSLPTRSVLLTPLCLAALSPLALYLLAPYRTALLFRAATSFRAAGAAVIAYVVLLWTLYFIDQEQGSHLQLDWYSQLLLILGACGAPLLEEIVFRELVPVSVGRDPHYFGHGLAILVFAGLHFPLTLEMFALYCIAAFALAEVRLQSDGLLYGTLAHAAANVSILLAL